MQEFHGVWRSTWSPPCATLVTWSHSEAAYPPRPPETLSEKDWAPGSAGESVFFQFQESAKDSWGWDGDRPHTNLLIPFATEAMSCCVSLSLIRKTEVCLSISRRKRFNTVVQKIPQTLESTGPSPAESLQRYDVSRLPSNGGRNSMTPTRHRPRVPALPQASKGDPVWGVTSQNKATCPWPLQVKASGTTGACVYRYVSTKEKERNVPDKETNRRASALC